jgi:hypothetical protein
VNPVLNLLKLTAVLVVLLAVNRPASAQGRATAAWEAAEKLFGRFGAKAGKGIPELTARIEGVAARYGDDAIKAVRNGGPSAAGSAMTVDDRLRRIEALLTTLLAREPARAWYSVGEFARLVGRSSFTVREWCRLGRLAADKKQSGCGAHPAWAISHDEYQGLRSDRQATTHPDPSSDHRNQTCSPREVLSCPTTKPNHVAMTSVSTTGKFCGCRK